MAPALSPRHRAFVDAYAANGGNGTKAAAAAGYKGKPDALAVRASRMLKRLDIKAALAEAKDASPGDVVRDERPARADRAEIEIFWTRLMRGEDSEGRPLKLGLRDQLEASRLLARSLGVFLEPDQGGKDGEIDRPTWEPLVADDVALKREADTDLNASLEESIEAKDAARRTH